MSNLIDPKSFGLKLYDRFPEAYKEDDRETGYTLKRYMETAGEGFSAALEEMNGIADLIDPLKIPSEHLGKMFSSYGLELFYGIPEPFLRNLIPVIGKLFARKGTLSSIEFLTSLISGVETTIDLSSFLEDNTLRVHLYIDYDKVGNTFPSQEQLVRIANEFMPFYCNIVIFYTFYYADKVKVNIYENHLGDSFLTKHHDSGEFDIRDDPYHESVEVQPENEGGNVMFSEFGENSCILNHERCLIGESFYLSSITGYDTIWENGEKRIQLMTN